jgi:O-antigen/teichoic acid export membrane protein
VTSQTATIDRAVQARRTVRFDSALLVSGAMAISGVLTYAFQILAARRLDGDEFGQIAVLWGGVFLLAIVVFRPLEQTLARSIADRLAAGAEVASVVRTIAVVGAAATAVIAIAAAAAWRPITNGLFHGDGFMTAMLVAGAAGYGASYIVRGLLGGVRWFPGYAAVLLADSVGRLAVAAPLLVVASPHLAAAAVAAAGVIGGAAPFLWARRWLSGLRGGTREAPFDGRGALRFAGPAGAVAAADQLLINGGPLLVILIGSGGTKEAGIVFAATMLVRAPVYVFTGVAAALLPNFTLLVQAGRRTLAEVFAKTTKILVAAGVVIVAGVAVLGPRTMDLLYGDGFGATQLDLVLLAGSVALYLVSATFLQALLAFERGAAGAAAWLTAGAVLILAYALSTGDELERVSIALLIATAVNALLHGGLVARLVVQQDPQQNL